MALPVADALTEVLRSGARELLQQAVEAEVAEFVARHGELKDERERQRVVRNGYLPARTIQTGIGEVPVKAPRVRESTRDDQVPLKHPAALPAAHEEYRRAAALVVLERTLDGRLLERADGVVGPGRAGTLGGDHQPAERGVERRIRPVVEAEFDGQEFCLPGG